MPTQTINLNNTGPAAPSGSKNVAWQADAASLDPTVVRNVSASVSILVGDTGAGGTAGLAPAPAVGDAAAGKYLKADGTYKVPLTLPSGSGNKVLATPADGSSAASALRAMVTSDMPANDTIRTLGITIDGGGNPPATGIKGYLTLPYNCTIVSWTCIADQAGSASVDVCYVAGSGAPPTAPNVPTLATNKISASAPVTLSSAQAAAGGASAISTWNNSLAQWGTLMFNLSAVTTCTRVTVQLQVQLS
jgi:hypothetical protein